MDLNWSSAIREVEPQSILLLTSLSRNRRKQLDKRLSTTASLPASKQPQRFTLYFNTNLLPFGMLSFSDFNRLNHEDKGEFTFDTEHCTYLMSYAEDASHSLSLYHATKAPGGAFF